MIRKNEFPILEYDFDSTEILKPNHGAEQLTLPEKCVFAFLGDTIDSYAAETVAAVAEHFETITKTYPIYVVKNDGEEFCLCQAPLGAPAAAQAIEKTFRALGLPFRECITWTTDGFFRETRDMVAYRKAEGCATVEMECAALAACAKKRGAAFGQILYTADSLANAEQHDDRDWGKDSLRKALELCVEVLRMW